MRPKERPVVRLSAIVGENVVLPSLFRYAIVTAMYVKRSFLWWKSMQANHATVEIHPKQARREAEICLDKEQKLMVTMVKLSAVVLIP